MLIPLFSRLGLELPAISNFRKTFKVRSWRLYAKTALKVILSLGFFSYQAKSCFSQNRHCRIQGKRSRMGHGAVTSAADGHGDRYCHGTRSKPPTTDGSGTYTVPAVIRRDTTAWRDRKGFRLTEIH